MSYISEFGPKADKSFKKLPRDLALRIINKLKQVEKDPFRYLKHYEGDSCYKLRIGKIRVLVDVDFCSTKLL